MPSPTSTVRIRNIFFPSEPKFQSYCHFYDGRKCTKALKLYNNKHSLKCPNLWNWAPKKNYPSYGLGGKPQIKNRFMLNYTLREYLFQATCFIYGYSEISGNM